MSCVDSVLSLTFPCFKPHQITQDQDHAKSILSPLHAPMTPRSDIARETQIISTCLQTFASQWQDPSSKTLRKTCWISFGLPSDKNQDPRFQKK